MHNSHNNKQTNKNLTTSRQHIHQVRQLSASYASIINIQIKVQCCG